MGLFTSAPVGLNPHSHLREENRYRRRSPETWDRAREDYAAGVSAPEVCDRHDVGLSALRKRAREEGWRRQDLPDPEPYAPPEDDGPPPSASDLAEEAYAQAARAVKRGDVRAVRGWLLAVRDLHRLADDEVRRWAEDEEVERLVAEDDAASAAESASSPLAGNGPLGLAPSVSAEPTEGVSPPKAHEPHAIHPVSRPPETSVPAAPSDPLAAASPAERETNAGAGDASAIGVSPPLAGDVPLGLVARVSAEPTEGVSPPKVHEPHAIHPVSEPPEPTLPAPQVVKGPAPPIRRRNPFGIARHGAPP